jgi:hypothetical protein
MAVKTRNRRNVAVAEQNRRDDRLIERLRKEVLLHEKIDRIAAAVEVGNKDTAEVKAIQVKQFEKLDAFTKQLTTLEVKTEPLFDNGQPGMLSKLKSQVEKHEKFIYALTLLGVIGWTILKWYIGAK